MQCELGDRFYHERRAAEELIAARSASNPKVRCLHEQLAHLHRRAARALARRG